MRTDLQTVEFALGLFSTDEQHGDFLEGACVDLGIMLGHAIAEQPRNARRLARLFGCITSDLWNVATIVGRLEWMHQQAIDSEDLESRWRSYAAVDVQSVHVEFRSIVDYMCEVVRLFAPEPGQVTNSQSFERLLNWLPENGPRLQPDVTRICSEQEGWFREMRDIRNNLVHRGAQPIIFGAPGDGVLFQVVDARFDNLIHRPLLMYNENVMHFDRYGALYWARLIAFLEDLSIFYRGLVQTTFPVQDAKCYGAGFGTLVQ